MEVKITVTTPWGTYLVDSSAPLPEQQERDTELKVTRIHWGIEYGPDGKPVA